METGRHTLSLAFIFLALIQVTAQTNGGFETWLPSGSPPPFDWLYPEGWTTNNATTEFITSGVKRSTDEHSGTYSAELRTLNIFGTLTRAQLALGSCLLDPPNYSILAHTGGEELSSVPSQVTFNYKLTSGAPGENAECVVLIKRGPSDTLWHTSVALTAAAMYTQVSVPFPDIDIIPGTDSIVLLFSSNRVDEAAANILYIDDVFIESASGIHDQIQGSRFVHVYPTILASGGTLNIEQGNNGFSTFTITDINGNIRFNHNPLYTGDPSHFKITHLTSGAYVILFDNGSIARFLVVD